VYWKGGKSDTFGFDLWLPVMQIVSAGNYVHQESSPNPPFSLLLCPQVLANPRFDILKIPWLKFLSMPFKH
jgi:hypothetical protein